MSVRANSALWSRLLSFPTLSEAQARNNLRQLLHQLRQTFPTVEHFLSTDTHTLHWHSITPFHLDVAAFEQTLNLADAAMRRNDQHELQAALELADTLYRGELLPGCYDEWILPERERLRQHHFQALERLLRLFEEQGNTVSAIRYAQRLLCIALRRHIASSQRCWLRAGSPRLQWHD